MDDKLRPASGQVFGDGPPLPGSEPQSFEIESLAAPR
jgi:hypothetical protein